MRKLYASWEPPCSSCSVTRWSRRCRQLRPGNQGVPPLRRLRQRPNERDRGHAVAGVDNHGDAVACDARRPINAAQRSFPELRITERLSLSRGVTAALRRTEAQQRPEFIDQGTRANDPAAF